MLGGVKMGLWSQASRTVHGSSAWVVHGIVDSAWWGGLVWLVMWWVMLGGGGDKYSVILLGFFCL